MLFEPERHERPRELAWDEMRARDTIARIVAEAERSFDAERLWPAHPLDAGPSIALYMGAAGVIWAIDHLAEEGAAVRVREWAPIAESLFARSRVGLDAKRSARSGFAFGDVGLALAGHRVTRARVWIDRLIAAGRECLGHESHELCAGAPGALLATASLLEEVRDPRLADLVRELATRVLAELRFEPEHGLAANACALIRAGRAADIASEIERALDATALVEDGLANWPHNVGEPRTERGAKLVQICHGAPGVIVALAHLEPRAGSRLEELLRMGGELTWRAGPLAKGSGLCHGTAGNGYAFLCLHRRTGERVWLERARAFAMHAIGQWEAELARHGRGRYSLWPGDPGLACFLWSCVRERDEFPTLHVL